MPLASGFQMDLACGFQMDSERYAAAREDYVGFCLFVKDFDKS